MNALETTQNASIRGGDDDFIKSRIFSIRGVQVMLDCDLAALYGVETKILNQAVKRVPYAFTEQGIAMLSAVLRRHEDGRDVHSVDHAKIHA